MPPPLQEIVRQLRNRYGRPKPPKVTDPFGMILWENVAYLLDDDRRAAAFDALRKKVGTTPARIAGAPAETLLEVARLGGMLPEMRAGRIRFIAALAMSEFQGDLWQVLKLPLPRARKALKLFPSIGDPGADKILLFTATAPILALDSNALRVLVRLGFGVQRNSYSATYRSAQAALAGQTGNHCAFLVEAHQLLRRHGQELCRAKQPACSACPLVTGCRYGIEMGYSPHR